MAVSAVNMNIKAKQFVVSHTHDAWEVVINLLGHGYTWIKDKKYPYKPGTIFCIPPNTPHAKTSTDGFSDIFLHTTFFSLSKFVDENDVIILQDDQAKSFESLMHMSFRAFCSKNNNYQALVNALYESMNQLLISWLAHQNCDMDIENIKSELMRSFSDPDFSVAELCADAPYCMDHMRRRFKRATGMTPVEFLTNIRLNYAKKLMAKNHQLMYSISEIGAMSGYYDNRYFSRVFKKNVGMTPQEYMRLTAPSSG